MCNKFNRCVKLYVSGKRRENIRAINQSLTTIFIQIFNKFR